MVYRMAGGSRLSASDLATETGCPGYLGRGWQRKVTSILPSASQAAAVQRMWSSGVHKVASLMMGQRHVRAITIATQAQRTEAGTSIPRFRDRWRLCGEL